MRNDKDFDAFWQEQHALCKHQRRVTDADADLANALRRYGVPTDIGMAKVVLQITRGYYLSKLRATEAQRPEDLL